MKESLSHLRLGWSVCVCVQLCPILCDPMDCSSPGSSDHGVEFSRQEYWSGLPFPTPGALAMSLASPVLAGGFFTTSVTWTLILAVKQATLVLLHAVSRL